MSKHRIAEILCILILVVFIGVLSVEETISDKTAKEVGSLLFSQLDCEGLKEQSELEIKKELSVSADSYEGIYYIKSDEIMDVREILVIKLNEGQSADSAVSKIEKRIEKKQTLFDGYAPEQSAMLQNYVLKVKAGFVFYAVWDDSAAAVSALNKIL